MESHMWCASQTSLSAMWSTQVGGSSTFSTTNTLWEQQQQLCIVLQACSIHRVSDTRLGMVAASTAQQQQQQQLECG
jgi:hypothetical protein